VTAPSQEPIDLLPFDQMTQKEEWEHIQRYHGYTVHYRYSLDSKSRKADLQSAHEKMHLKGEVTPGREHTHTAVAPREDATPEELAALELGKPLNASQRKSLKDIVENDFLALKAEIVQFAGDIAKTRRDDIDKDFAKKGADQQAFEKKGRDLLMKYRNERDKLILDARAKGVELSLPQLKYGEVEAKMPGRLQAIAAAEADVEADKRRALNALERARLTAQRKVLMTGVTEESLKILDTIPSAKTLMLEAAAERSNPQLAMPSV